MDGQARFAPAGQSNYQIEAVNILALSPLSGLFTYPNPFNPLRGSGKVLLQCRGSGSGTIKVYSIHGRQVRTITVVSTTTGANDGLQVWDGRDDNGVLMPNDVYFYSISIKDSTSEVKAKEKLYYGKNNTTRMDSLDTLSSGGLFLDWLWWSGDDTTEKQP